MSRKSWLSAALAVGVLLAAGSTVAQAGDPFVLFPSAPALSLSNDNTVADGAMQDNQKFVHPISAPYFAEDSFVTTDLRGWYAYHEFDPGSVLGGGEDQVLALQVRVALTKDLQLVAYKDGWQHLHSGLIKKDGWNDIAAGLKWEFLRDAASQTNLSAGAGYQLPWGESSVLQNKEELRLWLAGDKGFGPLHLGGTFNYFFATGASGSFGTTDHLSLHTHIDYYICKYFSPVVEFNYYLTTRDRGTLPIQGADVTNLGGGKADDILTYVVGAELRPIDNLAIRGAFERNMINPRDVFDNRVTVSAVLSF